MIPIELLISKLDEKLNVCRLIREALTILEKPIKCPNYKELLIVSLNFCLCKKAALEYDIDEALCNIDIIETINSFEPNIYTQ